MGNIASVQKRIIGGLVDMVLLMVGYMIFGKLFGTAAGGVIALSGIPAFIYLIFGFLYFVLMEGRTGQTVGKMVAKTKVVNASWEQINMQEAVLRTLLRFIDGFLFYLVGLIVIVSSEKNQRLGDLVAKTYVVDA